ncbi:DUF890 domain-containing protein [Metarhizium album ARSEF 1941]|uniref:DUF890 domain-containing protein n=1 Tax=Metarhizium album (strain ARSEF 1941) TaxID=1081103 RepID=A0A0B2X0I4_METAS|nr:DUF890 domain-containing protein [Metarhizium album ARSEF 1941]KHN99354.1 DUF890 domain-containing protein [Metarhizium album ARSEF 1941]
MFVAHFHQARWPPIDANHETDAPGSAKGRDVDFRDPKSVVQLTKTLLELDFGIKIELPPDRLCPPVPNRHSYILWLKDLLDTSSYDEPGRKRTGMDIGTGASCIYPLLGSWRADIDAESLKWARRNVEINGLSSRINVVARSADSALIPLDELGLEAVDFTMTNPPFYESEEDLLSSAKKKKRPPHTACTGSSTEMVTPGGELAFVVGLLKESCALRTRIQWYSAMFGFLSNLVDFIGQLRAYGVTNYAVTEFVQGNKTRRWAVAWSFQPMRPAQHVARGTRSALSRNILPRVTEAEVISFEMPRSIGGFAATMTGAIESLDLISWSWDTQAYEGTGRAADKVWARAWRRRKKREQQGADGDEDGAASQSEPRCMFGFKVWIRVSVKGVVVVGCRWVEGFDATAFESFGGFLQSTAKAAAGLQ